MNKKINIVFLVRPTLGGIQRHLIDLIKSLDGSKFSLTLAGSLTDKMKSELEGFELVNINIADRLNPIEDIKSAIKLRQTLKKIKPQILHMHGNKAALIGQLASFGIKIKKVFTVHNFQSLQSSNNSLVKLASKMVDGWIAKKSDIIITVSNALKNDLTAELGESRLEDKVSVIHNGINQGTNGVKDSRLNFKSELGISESQNLIGFVGRFADQKQPLDFIKTASLLYKKNKDLRFVMVGSGPLLSQIEQAITKYQLSQCLFLLDYRNDVSEIIKSLDVFVLTSKWEGLPYIVLEVMAAGTPIVSTSVGGVNEVIENGKDGMLVEPGNIEGLGAAIIKLISDNAYAKKITENAASKIKREFSIEKMVNANVKIYEKLIN
jgi:glycosyltransferase involved in cell wall biosynthesis